MIKLTEEARSKISDALNRPDPPRRHLRIRASVEAGAFTYHLEALTDEMVTPHDTVLECGEFDLVLDPESAERLEGTRIDYRETLVESGFRFDNPNRPASPTLPTGERTDLEGPVPRCPGQPSLLGVWRRVSWLRDGGRNPQAGYRDTDQGSGAGSGRSDRHDRPLHGGEPVLPVIRRSSR